ncbi:MAG: hypothetical protein AAF570_15370, partial [Bacteroidota bacterium]
VTGGTAPYFFQWACDTTVCCLDSTNDDDPSICATPGCVTYYVQAFDINGNMVTDSVEVCRYPTPIVDAGPDNYICGDSAPCVILNPSITNAPGPYTYSWSPAAGLNSANILNPCARPQATTTYTLTATSGNNCTSVPDSNAMVTVTVYPIPIADAGPDIDLCEGDTAMLQGFGFGAGPNYSYEWTPSFGLSDPFVANPSVSLPVGVPLTQYALVVWSNNCPSYADTVTVNVHPLPATPTITQVGDTLFGPMAPSWQWCLNGQAIPGANQQYHIPTTSGNYQVKVFTNFGCSSASGIITDVAEMSVVGEVRLFPNPNVGQLRVELPVVVEELRGVLLGMDGKRWADVEMRALGGNTWGVDVVDRVPEGVYLLMMDGGDGERWTVKTVIR